MGGGDEPDKIVVDLNEEILSWLGSATTEDPIRVISGGPGSGKSSFVRMLTASLADSTLANPIYILLQRFALGPDLRDAVGKFLSEARFFKNNPLAESLESEPPCLLIFDGLDELTKPGEQADEVARDFLIELHRTIISLNTQQLTCLAIVTGRTVAIQKSRSAIRQSGRQELHVMKFYYDERELSGYDDESNRLKEDWNAPHEVVHPLG